MSALAISTPDDGLTRSAQLMHALGPDGAAVWAELSPEESRALTAAMDGLTADAQHSENVSHAFTQALSSGPKTHSGAKDVWARLSGLETETLRNILSFEHPQTVAFILSRINGDAAARALKALSPALSIDAMQRLLNLGMVHPATTRSLGERFATMLSAIAPKGSDGGHERVARIFDRLDDRSEKVFLAALENAEPGAGEKVRALMFTFDDLSTLDAGGLQTLLSAVERAVLVIALKGAKDETSAAFFKNMTKRAGELLGEEIESLGAVRRSEVDAARRELVALARTLIHRGDIRVSGDETDEELVE